MKGIGEPVGATKLSVTVAGNFGGKGEVKQYTLSLHKNCF